MKYFLTETIIISEYDTKKQAEQKKQELSKKNPKKEYSIISYWGNELIENPEDFTEDYIEEYGQPPLPDGRGLK